MLEELKHIQKAGQPLDFAAIDGDQLREVEPNLSSEIGAGLLLRSQRFINPGAYMDALAQSFIERGGEIVTDVDITAVYRRGTDTLLTMSYGDRAHYVVVLL